LFPPTLKTLTQRAKWKRGRIQKRRRRGKKDKTLSVTPHDMMREKPGKKEGEGEKRGRKIIITFSSLTWPLKKGGGKRKRFHRQALVVMPNGGGKKRGGEKTIPVATFLPGRKEGNGDRSSRAVSAFHHAGRKKRIKGRSSR